MSTLRNPAAALRRSSNRDRVGEQPFDQRYRQVDNRRKTGPLTVREIKALLHEFEATLLSATPEPKLLEQHQRLLGEFANIHTRWEKRQVFVAEGFNVLRTMRLTRKELCHSDILAWLLDHRLDGFGTHAQGKRGFQLFLRKIDLPAVFAEADYRVAREVSGQESRLDLLVEADGEFLIGIENKVASEEMVGLEDGEDQTVREWNDLRRRGKKLGVRASAINAFFLTPGYQLPRSKNFKAISWGLVADVFEAFADEAKPRMVRLFAQHYAETLRRDVVSETTTKEEENE